jgi:L-2-hydroxycarboxylate dehydrogenase (NAD+)
MQVTIVALKSIMHDVLAAKSYNDEEITFIIDMYLGGELRGHVSHGLAKFPGFAKKEKLDAKQEIIKSTPACYYVDAKSGSGILIGKQAADEAITRARQQITGTALIRNMGSWLRPGGIAYYIADKGFVAIVFNSGGIATVAPPGGYDPVAGTNPLAYGIPTSEGALVVDMATSKRAWGEVLLANTYGTDLPADTYFDRDGNETRDPKYAKSAKPFGEYKGFSIVLLIEILCGALVGMEMPVQHDLDRSFGQTLPARGAFILVIDPEQTIGRDAFTQATSAYIDLIRNSNPLPGQQVRIPGDTAGQNQAKHLAEGTIDIADDLWDQLQTLR